MNKRIPILPAFISLVLCVPFKVLPSETNPAHERLSACISEYEDGNYQTAADSLKALLPALSDPVDQIEAYRYLGYSYGMLNWIDKSKKVFKTALGKFPNMDIDTLEVPPNITIIFKQAKLERKIEMLDTARAAQPKIIVQKRNVLAPVLLLSLGIVSAAASINLFVYGSQQHQKYLSVNTPDQHELDMYFSNYRTSFIAGAACAGVTLVCIPVSLHLFLKKGDHKKTPFD